MASNSSHSSRSSHTAESRRTYSFNGSSRTLVKWSAQSKDRDLWLHNGDCLVSLVGQATPTTTQYALNIHFSVLQESKNEVLIARCRSQSRYPTKPSSHVLHILPSPSTFENSLPHELTSRNYFAFLFNKPLVSTQLGPAMISLWDRVQEWHAGDDEIAQRLLSYFKEQGYLHAANNPHAACAALAFADHAAQRAIWSNALVHCVAMYTRLDSNNPEYFALSNTTKALITRAALEMDSRVCRFSSAVGSFLEDDFSTENLGLVKPARDHLDRFRSFLQSFFVEKLEYFPPSVTAEHFNLSIWEEVLDDFQSLYEYIADKESSRDVLGDRGVTGGVCVMQNVQAFDSRHAFSSLPHPLPLLPLLAPVRRMTESQVSLRNLKLIRLESDFRPTAQDSLAKASNSDNADLLAKPIIQEYIGFETQKLQEKLSLAEARKVRWLLIYGCLQMLKSIMVAPADVEHTEECVYPLGVSLASCPIVDGADTYTAQAVIQAKTLHLDIPEAADEDADHISIHPDCEADSAHDFLTLSRKGSQLNTMLQEGNQGYQSYSVPSSPISRTLSMKSVTALSRSVVGGLSRRNSSRMSWGQMPRKMPSFCDIVVESTETTTYEDAVLATPIDQDLADFDFGLEMPTRQKSIKPSNAAADVQTQQSAPAPATSTSDIDQDDSMSPSSDTSRRSSTYSNDCETPNTEPSSRSNSTRESKTIIGLAPLDEERILETDLFDDVVPEQPQQAVANLSAGCYTPTGMATYDVPMSKFAAHSSKHVYERRSQVSAPSLMAPKRPAVIDHSYTSHIGNQRRTLNTLSRRTYSDMP